MTHLSSKPLPALELIRATLRLFSISFIRSLPYALAGMLLLFAATVGGAFYILQNEFERTSFLGLIAVLALLCPICMAPLLYRVHALAHGRTVSLSETLWRGLQCLLPCLLAGVLYLLAVGIGAVFLLLPGLYLLVALSFWWLALVVDDAPILDAFRASLQLVRGHWWHVAVGYSFIYPVTVVVDAFHVNWLSPLPGTLAAIVEITITVLLTTVLPIFVCASMVVIHHDLTLRSALAKAAEPVVPA